MLYGHRLTCPPLPWPHPTPTKRKLIGATILTVHPPDDDMPSPHSSHAHDTQATERMLMHLRSLPVPADPRHVCCGDAHGAGCPAADYRVHGCQGSLRIPQWTGTWPTSHAHHPSSRMLHLVYLSSRRLKPLLPATRSAGSLMLPPELEFEKDQVFHQFINHNREITELQHILRKAKMKRELWDIEHPTSPALSMSPATTSTTPLSASSVPPSSASVSSTPGVVTPDHDTADSKRKRHRSRSHRRGGAVSRGRGGCKPDRIVFPPKRDDDDPDDCAPGPSSLLRRISRAHSYDSYRPPREDTSYHPY